MDLDGSLSDPGSASPSVFGGSTTYLAVTVTTSYGLLWSTMRVMAKSGSGLPLSPDGLGHDLCLEDIELCIESARSPETRRFTREVVRIMDIADAVGMFQVNGDGPAGCVAQTISEVRVPDPHNDPWRQRRPWSFKQQAPAGRGSVVNRVAPAAVCGDDLAGDQSTAFRCEIADSDCRDVDLRLFDAGGDDPASDPLYRVGVVVCLASGARSMPRSRYPLLRSSLATSELVCAVTRTSLVHPQLSRY